MLVILKKENMTMTKTEIKKALETFPKAWKDLLKEEIEKPYYQNLIDAVAASYENEKVYPPYDQVFRAFSLTRPEEVKVVILGQDPYHEEYQANGLAFSVSEGVILPKSLINIYKELNLEYGYPRPLHNGGLEAWARQGVLLLNASLTVKEGQANSHSKLGWTTFTDAVISCLDRLDQPIVYLLWGNYALKKQDLIHNPKANIVHTAHPSPLSASRGFFHSDCFKMVNQYLLESGVEMIDWQIKD